MKKILYASLLILSATLLSCAQEESNVEVSISSSPFPLIPAPATSCLAVANAKGGEAPSPDISPDYFRVPTITFNRKDASKTLIIAFIRISIPIPGSSSAVNCETGGDNLAALKTEWFSANREAVIPPGTSTLATTCALYCGSIKLGSGLVAAGTMEVFGLERDASGNETPVKTSTAISIQSF